MSQLLGSFHLPSPEYGGLVEVELYRGVEDHHIEFINTQWMPILKRRQDKAILDIRAKGITDDDKRNKEFNIALASYGAPDGHWDWRDKISVGVTKGYVSFVVCHGQNVEAIMDCNPLHFARIPSQSSQPAIYINHVAVAPWNRIEIQESRRFNRLGDLMMGTAVSFSIDEGFNGRVGLHSLSQARGFYEHHCGMSDLGPDNNYQGLHYYEFTENQASEFIA